MSTGPQSQLLECYPMFARAAASKWSFAVSTSAQQLLRAWDEDQAAGFLCRCSSSNSHVPLFKQQFSCAVVQAAILLCTTHTAECRHVLHLYSDHESGRQNNKATRTWIGCDTCTQDNNNNNDASPASRSTHNASVQSQQAMFANVCPSFCHQRPGILLLNHNQLCWTTDD